MSIPFSILDLCAIADGATAADALHMSATLAQRAEALGYNRFWLAEHHNMPGIASAATSVVIGHVAGQTKSIRVGSGGVMLPNHSPLAIAEQFGTLASLYPERIDLGLGRAPGSDQTTARALRRDPAVSAERFPQDVVELLNYFSPQPASAAVHAVPGEGLDVPVWLLGSSLYSARLAAMLGLPFAFASHFAPDDMQRAGHLYRSSFQASAYLAEPYLMLSVNVVAAQTDNAAARIFSSQQQAFLNLRRGKPGKLPAPVDNFIDQCAPMDRAMIEHTLAQSYVGSPETVELGLRKFIERMQPDEIMIAGSFYTFEDRLQSLECTAQILNRLRCTSELSR